MRKLTWALLAGLLVGACADRPAPRSVVLIVVDTLRADHLGTYGYARETSPEIDALAENAAVYDHAYAPSPWTLPSFGSLFTGRLPAEHRAGWPAAAARSDTDDRDPDTGGHGREFLPLEEDVWTLAQVLAAKGKATGAVINNAFLHSSFGIARGFQSYDHVGGNRKRIRRADEVVDRALEWLGEPRREDFFLVVHFFDPHLNYDAPEGFRGRFSSDMADDERHEFMDLRPLRQRIRSGDEVDWDFLIGAYDEEIAFVDQEIGRFMRALEETQALDDTVVILTADHGEEFGDHGGFEHGHTVFDELLRVPFIVWGPGVEPGRRPTPISLIDVFPTILEALELPAQPELPGRSLWAELRRDPTENEPRTLIAERTLYGPERESALAWPYKLIHEPKRKRAQLFNLEEDPGETRDITRLRSAVTRDLLGRLRAYREHADARGTGDAATLDEETLKNLRSLGYIE